MMGSDSNLTLSRRAGDFAGRRKAGVMGVMGASRGWGVLGTEGAGEDAKGRTGGPRGKDIGPVGVLGPERRTDGSKADGS